jgi:hypothetical protein
MSPVSGYSLVDTILRVDGTPVAIATSIGMPAISQGLLDTTVLNPANRYRTTIPDGLIAIAPFDCEGLSSPGEIAAMQALLEADAVPGADPHAILIDLPDGDSLSFDAWLTKVTPSGANIGSPSLEKFSFTLSPTGDFAVVAATAWYTGTSGLFAIGGDISEAHGAAAQTLDVLAIGPLGFGFLADNSLLTFTSSDPSKATVGLHTGLLTPAASGTTEVSFYITGHATYNGRISVVLS